MAADTDTRRQLDAAAIRERWTRGVSATRTARHRAALNHQFVRGSRHWLYHNERTNRLEEYPRDPDRLRVSMPRIGPDSRRIMAKLLRRNLPFEVMPRSADDVSAHAARIAEAAVYEAHRSQHWEKLREDHAWAAWEGGVAGVCVEWDDTTGTPVAMSSDGRPVHTGDVKLSVCSIHEIVTTPGSRDVEKARWWMRGFALPSDDVRDLYDLPSRPAADARAADGVLTATGGDEGADTPMTLVLTHFERPGSWGPGGVTIVVGDRIVAKGQWYFPFDDRLNLCVSSPIPLHGTWVGATPVTDAIGTQVAYNMAWSSILEHIKLAGNARLWVPMGSVRDVEDLSDTPGEAVEYNPINGQRPQYETPPAMPDWWVRSPEMLAAVMDDTLSQHDVSRGEAPAGVESGVALSILSENDDTPIGALAKSFGEMWGRVASLVLRLYEANVAESRESRVYNPETGVPDTVQWTGESIKGHVDVTVPLDGIMPRSRAAQAAYALQLHDRGIIQDPYQLAKVADLPDQGQLMEAIDPDTSRARRENAWMSAGTARLVDMIDNHGNHLNVHRDFMRSARYEQLDQEQMALFMDHLAAHEQYAAEQAAAQQMAAGVSPVAAMTPTAATKPVPPELAIQAAQAAHQAEMSAAMASMPTTAPPEGEPTA